MAHYVAICAFYLVEVWEMLKIILMPAIEITTKIGCANNCLFCPQDKLIKKYKSGDKLMSLEGFIKYIDKIPTDVDIHFSGFCEPWQNPFCAEMILHAHKKGHKISVFTTLVGVGKNDISKIKDIPFEYFSVHLPSTGNLEKIKINIDYLEALTFLLKSSMQATFHYHGLSLNSALRKYFANFSTKVLRRNVNDRAGNVSDKKLFKDAVLNREKKNSKKVLCQRLHQNVLLPNGDVVLCCMDYTNKHILGNLSVDKYEDLFGKDEFLRVENGINSPDSGILCNNCSELSKRNIYD